MAVIKNSSVNIIEFSVKHIDIEPYLVVTKILNIIEVLYILIIAEISQYIHIAICKLIFSEYIVVWYNDNLFTVPNLRFLKSKPGRYFQAQPKDDSRNTNTHGERVGILIMSVAIYWESLK
jgi:hypothetical protein